MPPTWEKYEKNTLALYSYEDKSVYIKISFYNEHGLDDFFLSCLFHELVHAYCHAHGIQYIDGDFHQESFADACRKHGGISLWEDYKHGFSNTILNKKTLESIRQAIERR